MRFNFLKLGVFAFKLFFFYIKASVLWSLHREEIFIRYRNAWYFEQTDDEIGLKNKEVMWDEGIQAWRNLLHRNAH